MNQIPPIQKTKETLVSIRIKINNLRNDLNKDQGLEFGLKCLELTHLEAKAGVHQMALDSWK
jgi:hypothetical protein